MKLGLFGLLPFVATTVIFGANIRMISGPPEGKPGGIEIGNMYGSTAL